MRTNEERIRAMHKRASVLFKEKRRMQARAIGTAAAALCLVCVILLAVFMPGLTGAYMSAAGPDTMAGSIFSGSPALGYLVIIIIAFLLGGVVTAFCFRLKKWQEQSRKTYDDKTEENDKTGEEIA